jgi:alpha-L-arabinofuranosidase
LAAQNASKSPGRGVETPSLPQMEKNADLIVMQCYAPLLVNVSPGARQWRPDVIGYDALRVYGSPSYQAIKLFSTHVGDEILKATAADTDVLVSVTRESRLRTLYGKLVNPGEAAASVQLNVTGAAIRPIATALTIAGSAQDTNSIDAPERVVPKATSVSGVKSGFTYTVPANGHRRADARNAVGVNPPVSSIEQRSRRPRRCRARDRSRVRDDARSCVPRA